MPDPEITLTRGDWKLTVAPYGASLRGLRYRGETVITGYMGRENKVGGQGDVLIPFPGRVAGGAYAFDGQRYQMAANDKDGPNAIHGFLRSVVWDTAARDDHSATFATRLDSAEGYPFVLKASVTYELTDDGLACRFAVENVGDSPAPVGVGFHPYFTVGSEMIDGDTLHVPMASVLEFDDALIPTGNILPVSVTPFDFREPRQIGATKFNTCFCQPERDDSGRLTITLASENREISVWMDGAFGFVVLFSGDPLPETHRRRALAVEPMTCGSDAFNHPEWGLARLAPGAVLTGTWGVAEK